MQQEESNVLEQFREKLLLPPFSFSKNLTEVFVFLILFCNESQLLQYKVVET